MTAASALVDLQRWFADAVTAGASPPEGATARRLTPGPRMSAVDRLDVYRSGYRSRLVECLADDYPATRQYLGEPAFEAIAHRYIEEHPSRSPSLNAFGRRLPAFLEASGLERSAFAADLSRLEWALVEAIHAAAADPLTPERLAGIAPEAWEGARLRAAPSVQVLHFDHDVDAYYQAFRDERPAVAVAGPSATLVHRRGWVVWRRGLTPPMAKLLAALLAGARLGDALAASASDGEGHAGDITAWFQDWVAAGVFSGIETREP